MDMKLKMDRILSPGTPKISQKMAETMAAKGIDPSKLESKKIEDTKRVSLPAEQINDASSENELSVAVENTDEQSSKEPLEIKSDNTNSEIDPIQYAEEDVAEQSSKQEDTGVSEQQKLLSNYAEKKINKLHRANKEKNEELAAITRELASLRQEISVKNNPPPTSKVTDYYYIDPTNNYQVNRPDPMVYNGDMPQYISDMNKFMLGKQMALEKEREQFVKNQEQERIQRDYMQRAKEAEANHYPDFFQVVQEAGASLGKIDQYHPMAIAAIQDSEQGPHISYYLAKHPEFVDQLVRKPPHLVLKEIGNLEGILEMSTKQKVVSSAPRPIVPKPSAGATKSSSFSKDALFDIPQTEWNASMKDRIRRNK